MLADQPKIRTTFDSVSRDSKSKPRTVADKPALAYLKASGAAPIFITEVDGVATIRTGGSKVYPRAVVVFWIMVANAKPVVKLARKLAGKNPDAGEAEGALRRATVECRATLTAHDVAVAHAGAAAAHRLDEYLSSVLGTGTLREFNRAFTARREAASYRTALARLRLALVPVLINGGKPVLGASLFATIFDT
jgi:hypothetical protein